MSTNIEAAILYVGKKTEKKLYFVTFLDIFWSYLRVKRPDINQNEGSTFYPVIKEFQGHLLTVHGSVASNFVKRKKFIQQKNLQKKSLYNRRNLKIYRRCLLRDPNIRVNVRCRRLDKSKYDLQGRDEQYNHQVLNKLYIKISLKIKQTWDI